jgi:iron complex outermembrane receptor protein
VDNLTVTADVFHIDIDDRIILGATFDNDASVALLADAGITDVGGVQYFTNGLDTRTQGVDITGNLRLPAGGSGTLDLTGSLNYTHNEIVNLDSIPDVLREAEGTIGSEEPEPGLLDTVNVIAIEDERPDWRATLQANYGVGRFSALGRFSYYGGFSSAQPGFCDLCRETYGGKALVDAELAYQFNLVKLAFGVRNLFDTYPDQPSSDVPVDPEDPDAGTVKDFNNNFGTFPWAAASPFGYNGRFAYARTEIQLAW